MDKLSQAQQKVVDILRENPESYVVSTPYWHWQKIIFTGPSGKPDLNRTVYFYRRTREILVEKGIIKEFEPNKFQLA